ncbi:p18 [Matsumuraeses phaseoli granulovirus]|uniref:P18 n=1 Tax=Matsumuraeses phaseoli granulovirus TaxID=2760664 RepID=A0AAE7SYB1_9BBAC|nr:p18 [Matsumuraeses phaseoli granulovirus]QOD40046.1 p18 [Matsumuraeses phaseoli granulovirus]
MDVNTLNLYTYKPSKVIVCNDPNDRQMFFLQGITEALYDNTKTKQACFLELKNEQNLLLKRIKNDIIGHTSGNYYKNHILLEVLHLYSKYCEEFNNIQSVFETEVVQMCRDMVIVTFELFNCVTNVVVFVEANVDKSNVISAILNQLEQQSVVTLIKTVAIV